MLWVPATVDWCEENYVWSPYVAEFFNTLSSALITAAGAYGLLTRRGCPRVNTLSVVVGVGSAAFHATLTYAAQMADELTMYWLIVYLLSRQYALRADVAVAYAAGWTLAHLGCGMVRPFQAHFTLLAIVALVTALGQAARDPRQRRLARLQVAVAGAAFACWLLDLGLCAPLRRLPFNPQLHAWWHLGMAVVCRISAHLAPPRSMPPPPPADDKKTQRVAVLRRRLFDIETGMSFLRRREHCPESILRRLHSEYHRMRHQVSCSQVGKQ